MFCGILLSRIFTTRSLAIWRSSQLDVERVLTRGAGVSLAMRVGTVMLAYGANVVLARWLGVSAYGQYLYALGWAVPLAAVGAFGLDKVSLRFVPAYVARSELGKLRGLLSFCMSRGIAGSLLVAVAVGGAVLVGGSYIPDDIRTAVLLGCGLIPLLVVTRLQSAILLGFKKIASALLHDLLRPALLITAVAAVFAATGALSVQVTIAALGVTLLVLALMQSILVFRSRPAGIGGAQIEFEHKVWASTIRAMFIIHILDVSMTKIDLILVGAMLDVDTVAVFGVAKRISGLILFGEVAVTTVATPIITGLHAESKGSEVDRIISFTARWILWPTLALAVLGALLWKPILGMFGPEYLAGATTLWILIGAQFLQAIVAPAFILIAFTGYHNHAARFTALVFVLHLILNVLGIKFFGMAGAAWAAVITALVWNGLLHGWVWSKLGVSSLPLIRRSRRPILDDDDALP